jgi:ATP-binding cassette subfamily C (CFTR/MRP) protein 4
MIWRSGYNTTNLGVVINFLLMIIDDIRSFMTSMADMENNFVSFDRCNQYLSIPPEEGYRYFESIESFLKKNHSSKLKIKKIEEKVEAKKKPRTENLSEDNLTSPLLDTPRHTNLKPLINKKGIQISMQSVKVKYSSELPWVLKGINLEIEPGQKVGIIGRTGAGKTSFVNLFVRFFDEYEGSLKLNGTELKEIYLESLRNNVTLISQDSYFFEGSLRENLDPKGLKSDEEIEELLAEAEILDKVMTLGGLDWKLKESGGEMSFGEKQIFCFIRAIINTRGLIIMDEATSNLDIKSEDVLEKLKEKYMKEATVLIIAHRLNTIHSCDKVLILENGKVQRFVDRTRLSTDELDYFKNYLKMFD